MTGSNIIADSSGLVSLISENDTNHKIAIKVSDELKAAKSLIIIPGDVFSETLNVISKKLGRDLALAVANELLHSEVFTLIETNGSIRDVALELFAAQANSVSFTDCIVMAFAKSLKAKDIFGFDLVFKKNGFNRLGFA